MFEAQILLKGIWMGRNEDKNERFN